MKITIYELLGLIKEGKAPNKIKYQDYKWIWIGDDYKTIKGVKECFLITGQEYVWVTEFLNDEIEIIEEEKEIEFEYIRELGIPEIDTVENERICRAEYKINDLIKNQKKIIDVINDMRDKE